MPKTSAGLLLYRHREAQLEVLLVHPGGPFWARKDEGAWSIPKGEVDPGEDALAAAHRELEEETGWRATGEPIELAPLRQAGGKLVRAWALAFDCDPATLRSHELELEWPPRSGKRARFPEVDRAAWFTLEEAGRRMLAGQRGFLEQLQAIQG